MPKTPAVEVRLSHCLTHRNCWNRCRAEPSGYIHNLVTFGYPWSVTLDSTGTKLGSVLDISKQRFRIRRYSFQLPHFRRVIHGVHPTWPVLASYPRGVVYSDLH